MEASCWYDCVVERYFVKHALFIQGESFVITCILANFSNASPIIQLFRKKQEIIRAYDIGNNVFDA